jgi:hypothetical protein
MGLWVYTPLSKGSSFLRSLWMKVLVAQLVEHKAENFGVAGSSPV